MSRFAAILAVVAAFLVITGVQCDCQNQYHNWMTRLSTSDHFTDKTLREIMLAGSHDAGTWSKAYHPTGLPEIMKEAAITQSKTLYEQLCAGIRVFDIRWKRQQDLTKGISSNVLDRYRIVHPPAGSGKRGNFFFSKASEIMAQVKQFCDDPAHKDEIVILRTKYYGHKRSPKIVPFFRAMTDLLGECVVRVEGDLADRVIATKTVHQISQQTGNHASVVIMAYGEGHEFGNMGDQEFRLKTFLHEDNMSGKATEMATMTHTLKGPKGQQAAYNNWRRHGKKENDKPVMFGFWLTHTAIQDKKHSAKGLDVRTLSRNLWTHGKWGRAACAWVHDNQEMGGVTIWHDFAGDEEKMAIMPIVFKYNENLAHERPGHEGIGETDSQGPLAPPSRPLPYTSPDLPYQRAPNTPQQRETRTGRASRARARQRT